LWQLPLSGPKKVIRIKHGMIEQFPAIAALIVTRERYSGRKSGAERTHSNLSTGRNGSSERRNVLQGFPPRLSGYEEECVVCQR
jgi:hypothetical protein